MIVAVSCGLFLMSCNQFQDARVPALETQVKDLEAKLTKLEEAVQKLDLRVAPIEADRDWEDVAYLTPGAGGYSVIKSNLGKLTVKLNNVQPYAKGSKITLLFGNLSAATIDGLKAKVEWGAVDKNGVPNFKEMKSREVTFTKSLQSGSWTNVPVILEGSPPAGIGFIGIRDVTHTGVRLRQ
jgi:outer membrane murein-binding lipoprotein Lpp